MLRVVTAALAISLTAAACSTTPPVEEPPRVISLQTDVIDWQLGDTDEIIVTFAIYGADDQTVAPVCDINVLDPDLSTLGGGQFVADEELEAGGSVEYTETTFYSEGVEPADSVQVICEGTYTR